MDPPLERRTTLRDSFAGACLTSPEALPSADFYNQHQVARLAFRHLKFQTCGRIFVRTAVAATYRIYAFKARFELPKPPLGGIGLHPTH